MADLKTKPTKASVQKFIAAIPDEQKRADAKRMLAMMKEATGEQPKMWGDSIVGFGSYHYVYASGREGDWPITGFSPRTQNLTVYIMPGFSQYQALLKKLGPHKTGSSCLYIKRLSDVNEAALKQLIVRSVSDMKKKYG